MNHTDEEVVAGTTEAPATDTATINPVMFGTPPLPPPPSTAESNQPAGLSLVEYAASLGLDPTWLTKEFGVVEHSMGASRWVEIPYRGLGGGAIASRTIEDPDFPRLVIRPEFQNRASEVFYGIDRVEGFTGDTIHVFEQEGDVLVAAHHGLQAVSLTGRQGFEHFARLADQKKAIRRIIVWLIDADDRLGEMVALPFKEMGWSGEVLELAAQSVCGVRTMTDLHLKHLGVTGGFDAEMAKLVSSAKAAQVVLRHKLSDCGNARRFVEAHGRDLRYLVERRKWLVWDQKRWVPSGHGAEFQLAKATASSIYAEAAREDDSKEAKLIAAWAMKTQSSTHIKAMLEMAETEPGIPVSNQQLDPDAYVLNVNNGTVDLRTGELRPHRREDLMTRMCPVDYDPNALCPVWEDLLELITGGKADLKGFLQRAVGYSVTGDTGEECLFFAYGHGKNGKSTFLETIAAVMGDYQAKTSAESLMTRRNSGIPNDIARLDGPRIVVASELEENRRWSEALVKDLTGNDTITARFLHKEYFQFKPKFKIWCYGNHKPNVNGTDTGFWRRMTLIPFTVTIPEEKRMSRTVLDAKLKAEWPGILAWMVRGCLAWQKDGLGSCPDVDQATTEYREENDVLASFLEEACVIQHNVRIRVKDLYAAYNEWAKDSGVHWVWTKQDFGKRLKEKGYVTVKSNGDQKWQGLTTKSPENWEHSGRREEAQRGFHVLPLDPEDPPYQPSNVGGFAPADKLSLGGSGAVE